MKYVVLDDRLLEYSYKLTDLLSIFHMALMNPSGWTFEQLDKKSRELLDHTNKLIETIDKGTFRENLDLVSLSILRPLIGLLKKISSQPLTLKKYENDYCVAISNFDLAVDRVSEFIEALTSYFKNEGRRNLTCYLP